MKKIIFLYLFSCPCVFQPCEAKTSKPTYSQRVYQVGESVAKDLQKRYQMEEFGGGYLKIAFQMNQLLTEEEARLLIVSCVDQYLNALNNDKFLTSQEQYFVFDEDDISLEIYFRDQSGYMPLHPYVSLVGSYLGHVTYSYKCPKIEHPFSETRVETYQEANQKLLEQCQLTTSQDRKFQRLAKAVIKQTASQIEGGQLEVEGAGFEGDKFSVRYRLYMPKNHREARAMVLKAADILVDKINASKALKGYLTEQPFTRENVDVTIHFITAKGALGPARLVLAPGVEWVNCVNEEVSYEFIDRTRRLRHNMFESYETSQLLLKEADVQDPVAQFISTLD